MRHLMYLAAVLLMSAHLARSAPIGAEVQSSNYDSVKGITTVRIVNTSQKLITAISVSLRLAHPDGTISTTHYGGDFLPFMAYAAASGIPQQSNGGLAPGAVFAMEVPSGQQEVKTTSANVEMVIYDDATADVLNETVFRSFTSGRKGRMLGLQRALELLQKALADPNDPHPSITVTAQLKALAARPNATEGLGLLEAATDISNAPKSPSGRSQEEDDYLRALIKTHQNRISFSLPHTQITKQVRP
jgi:hypothetical protein